MPVVAVPVVVAVAMLALSALAQRVGWRGFAPDLLRGSMGVLLVQYYMIRSNTGSYSCMH